VQIARRIKVQLMAPQCKVPHTKKKKKNKENDKYENIRFRGYY